MSSATTVLITGANRERLATGDTRSRLIVIKLDVSSAESINSGTKALTSVHNIYALDLVIANAGIAGMTDRLALTPVSEIQKYVDVNAYGQLELFRASKGKFVLISSAGGSLTTMNVIVLLGAYAASKALADFFKMVATEMGQIGFEALKKTGIYVTSHVISVEESTQGIKNVVRMTVYKEEIMRARGKFIGHDDLELPW
ncbi:hypothetical protein K469DRAFT_727067 [Zopfia rhizophila CBS 207.26]|uniref:NAD(P)-binding protein n=1 Tax=Zopfia rhizophila CBS 207.26 TaxID=1314779 RepID=A0A6A6E4R9_9PEZI|nr:hypothetical protein K469DRAFT_727067 [Zopfia rhizophila CBS 207.26]